MQKNILQETILKLRYKDKNLNKKIRIFKHTKSKRIKNKVFCDILSLSVKEKRIIKIEDCVLLDFELYCKTFAMDYNIAKKNKYIKNNYKFKKYNFPPEKEFIAAQLNSPYQIIFSDENEINLKSELFDIYVYTSKSEEKRIIYLAKDFKFNISLNEFLNSIRKNNVLFYDMQILDCSKIPKYFINLIKQCDKELDKILQK